MKQLNLVPASVRQKALTRRAVPYMVVAGLLGLAAAAAVWAGFGLQLNSLNANKASLLQAQADQQKQLAAQLSSVQVDSDLKSRVAQLNTLAHSDVDWNKAFTYVATLIPKEIVLSSYSFGTGQGAIKLKITGEAPSNVSYATFAEYLKENTGKVVTDFTVDGYAYAPQTGTVTFSMTLTVPQNAVSFATPTPSPTLTP